MAAVAKPEVLEVLSDPRLRAMRFSVGPINVNSSEYDRVSDLIESDAVSVVPWNETYSQYIPLKNRLMTHGSKLDNQIRSNLVHECTHVISDVNKVNVTRIADEVAAYLAQISYLYLLMPDLAEPPFGGPPINELMRQGMRLVREYGLGATKGWGAMIAQSDIADFGRVIHTVPKYEFSESEKLAVDGVTPTGSQEDMFFALQVRRIGNKFLDDLIAADVQEILSPTRTVAHENYVTWDPELLSLFDSYMGGVDSEKKAVLQKLLRIFVTVDQRSATQLLSRLSNAGQGDNVSRRFQSVFPTAVREALLSALRLSR
jgi:hypothetical protein